MENGNKQICRLCLELILDGDCEVIEESKKEILDILLIKIDFDISDNAVACNKCLGTLQHCFDFKSICFYVDDYIAPFVEGDVKVDIKNVFRKVIKTSENLNLDESQICRLCMSFIEDESFNCYTSDLKDMIRNCLPEVNLNSVDEPLVCKPCLSNMIRYNEFMKSCKEVEQKIKNYTQNAEDPGIANKVILEDVLGLKNNDTLSKPTRRQWIDVENETVFVKNEEAANIKCEEIEIKDELDIGVAASEAVKSGNGNNSGKNGSLKKRKIPKSNTKQLQPHIIKHKGKSKVEMHKCSLCPYKTKYKSGLTKHRKTLHSKNIEMYKCEKCSFSTKYRISLVRHQLLHKNPEEVQKYKCEKCLFETSYKTNLVKHMLGHKNSHLNNCAFSCDQCTYSSNNKYHMQKHKLIHQKDRIRKLYKCELCDYQAKTSISIKDHMIRIHMDPSKVSTFKCALCPYENVIKRNLYSHITKRHNDPSRFKCASCHYMTKKKENFKWHSLIHQEAAAIKCDQCDFRTKLKYSLWNHMKLHAPIKPMFKCHKCEYSTLQKSNLKQHKVTHTCAMYKCELCDYQAKASKSITNHVTKIHTDPSKVPTFKCTHCPYENSLKSNLCRHIRRRHNRDME